MTKASSSRSKAGVLASSPVDSADAPVKQRSLDALIAAGNAKIDMSQPLIWQMWKLNKEEYLAWVHDPYHYDGELKDAPLFQWTFLEPLSKTVWYVIPLVWLPVAAFCWHWYIASPAFSVLGAAACLAAGILLWTLVEYSVHRWVFHLDDGIPEGGVSILLHFLLHGIHHKVPMDRYRLVMPPTLFAVLATGGYWLFRALALGGILSWPIFHAVFGSVLVGYVCYDMVHYSQHHMNFARGSYLGNMKKYHMRHHFNGQQNEGYGITNKLWDYAFGTVLDVNARPAATAGGRDEKAILEAIAGKQE